MTTIRHLNCGWLHSPPNPKASCHCLLLQDRIGLALADTGIGLLDVMQPSERIGRPVIEAAGFQFNEADTAVRQIEALGFRAGNVSDIFLTHADPDHAGGLADFPQARVHVAEEELLAVAKKHSRYQPAQFAHGPRWKTASASSRRWFGLEARTLETGLESEVLLIPLFGHTFGHCGVAIRREDRWLLHVGDAYYLRVELSTDDHPVSALAAARADDNAARIDSLNHLRRLARDHAGEIEMFGYHDTGEFPESPSGPVA